MLKVLKNFAMILSIAFLVQPVTVSALPVLEESSYELRNQKGKTFTFVSESEDFTVTLPGNPHIFYDEIGSYIVSYFPENKDFFHAFKPCSINPEKFKSPKEFVIEMVGEDLPFTVMSNESDHIIYDLVLELLHPVDPVQFDVIRLILTKNSAYELWANFERDYDHSAQKMTEDFINSYSIIFKS